MTFVKLFVWSGYEFMHSDVTELRRLRAQPRGDLLLSALRGSEISGQPHDSLNANIKGNLSMLDTTVLPPT
jgi:hypothetical protein